MYYYYYYVTVTIAHLVTFEMRTHYDRHKMGRLSTLGIDASKLTVFVVRRCANRFELRLLLVECKSKARLVTLLY
jgi:hypothetical protein